MKQIIQPVPCCNELYRFSQKHYDIMLFVWKIKQGMKMQAEPERIASYCNYFWQNRLQQYFKTEEAALSLILSPKNAMIIKLLDDHGAIEIKLKELVSFPSYSGFHRLTQIISYHILYEEKQLFPYIEKTASEEQLNQLADKLIEPVKLNSAWMDAFWTIAKN